MLKEIKWDTIQGKTVSGISTLCDDVLAMTFTDGTFTLITTYMEYYEDTPSFKYGEFDLYEYYSSSVFDLGILSREEAQEIRDKRNNKDAVDKEVRELRELDRLKSKYEG